MCNSMTCLIHYKNIVSNWQQKAGLCPETVTTTPKITFIGEMATGQSRPQSEPSTKNDPEQDENDRLAACLIGGQQLHRKREQPNDDKIP